VCAALGILILLLTTSNSSAYKVCAEWVNEYHGYQKNLNNNDENSFVDDAHFAFFSGHGSMTGFYFGTEHDDHKLSNSDALWGNKKMDWIAIDACEVLRDEWWSHVTWRWGGSFEGLHLICGFHTTTMEKRAPTIVGTIIYTDTVLK